MSRLLAIRDLNQGDPLPLPGKKVEPPPAEPPRKRPEPVNGNPDILRGPDGKLYTDIDKNKGVRLRHSEVGAVVTPTGAAKLESYLDDLRRQMTGVPQVCRQGTEVGRISGNASGVENLPRGNIPKSDNDLSHMLHTPAVGDSVYVPAFGEGTVLAVVQDSVHVALRDGSKVYARAGNLLPATKPAKILPAVGDMVEVFNPHSTFYGERGRVARIDDDGWARVEPEAQDKSFFMTRIRNLRHA